MVLTPTPVYLSAYTPSPYAVSHIDLTVRLHSTQTRVMSTLHLVARAATPAQTPLVFAGDGLILKSAELNGVDLDSAAYTATPDSFTLHTPPNKAFTLTLETEVNPDANTTCMGLYRSNGVYCTQCEAEGFRRITYMYDRPDVLATYRVRLEADKSVPILLSNGNCLEKGDLVGGDHYAVWQDPWPKPTYLFALVGGDLDALHDSFTTMEGRGVALGIYVEKGKAPLAAYAMDALKRSMRWDEEAFGRAYDLDVFNIVAVSDFNMGAMENKGLNIFNDKYVLASPQTATDTEYGHVEAIVAHEYFHNWTGNRITCRDWFQLCLKEGLTVFRDQNFSADMRSKAVQRIHDVVTLRTRQFSEDAGALAHPVRPDQYLEINNFYTATIYEKGAEVIRMLRTLIGQTAFDAGMDLYFKTFDGTAATIEDFIQCFANVSKKDLTQFFRWYTQAGTPRVVVQRQYDAATQRYTLDFAQSTPPTPNQPHKESIIIPIVFGLLDAEGAPLLESQTFVLEQTSQRLVLENIARDPIPSLLRGFSAPVKIEAALTTDELIVLAAHDIDAFNRWQATQTLLMRWLCADIRGDESPMSLAALITVMQAHLAVEGTRDPAFAALLLSLPGVLEIAQALQTDIDPQRVVQSRLKLRRELASALIADVQAAEERCAHAATDSIAIADAARRALHGVVLGWRTLVEGNAAAEALFVRAPTMTDRLNALRAILDVAQAITWEDILAVQEFIRLFAHEPLAMDKLFALLAAHETWGTRAGIDRLMAHPHFNARNPNRLRAVVSSFANGNFAQFHTAESYAFIADQVAEVDTANPQVAARLLTAFSITKTLRSDLKDSARAVLLDLQKNPNLSRDVVDILGRMLV
jgi:aminopeptidase N